MANVGSQMGGKGNDSEYSEMLSMQNQDSHFNPKSQSLGCSSRGCLFTVWPISPSFPGAHFFNKAKGRRIKGAIDNEGDCFRAEIESRMAYVGDSNSKYFYTRLQEKAAKGATRNILIDRQMVSDPKLVDEALVSYCEQSLSSVSLVMAHLDP
ncbi:hypothetical protein Ancab_039177 [Ancistrocladus abbreviatus]